MDIGQGLASFGQSMAGAMNQYHQEHVAYDQQYQLAELMSRMAINPQGGFSMIDPNNPDKSLQPLLDKKAVELYQTQAHDKQIKATGALEALTRMGQIGMQHLMTTAQSNQPPAVFQGPDGTKFYRFPGGGSGVLQDSTTKGRDPAAQYVNAVHAHVTTMNAAGSYIKDNFNVMPAELLNSGITKGYVWNAAENKYDFAKEGQTPEAYQVYGQQGASPMISADQFGVAKKKAQEYQDLLNKFPKQEDFTRGGGGGVKTGGGVIRKIGDRGVINGQPVVWGMAPGATRPGWLPATAAAPAAGPIPVPAGMNVSDTPPVGDVTAPQ